MKEKLKNKMEMLGLVATLSDLDKFESFYHLLLETNKKFNLTNIVDEDEVINKHFIDSLVCAKMIKDGSEVVDVGSGAGFPGIPLSIMCKNSRFTLIDSLGKRVDFLNDIIARLGLNAIATHIRAEDAARGKYRECYDIAVARAVAPLNTLCEYCVPFIMIGGMFLSYKTNSSDEFISSKNAISVLGGKLREIKSFLLPQTSIQRSLVIIDKISATPSLYPRGKNKPKTHPL